MYESKIVDIKSFTVIKEDKTLSFHSDNLPISLKLTLSYGRNISERNAYILFSLTDVEIGKKLTSIGYFSQCKIVLEDDYTFECKYDLLSKEIIYPDLSFEGEYSAELYNVPKEASDRLKRYL